MPSRRIRAQLGWLSVLWLACAANAAAERLPIRTYTTTDGLAHNAVNRIVRDSRGFLWFCTDEGLSRFDGYAFSNFGTDQGLPHALVNDLLETRNGEYWLATGAGLVRFNPTGRPDSRVVYAHDGMRTDAMFTVVLPGDEGRRAKATTALLEGADGTLWVGTQNGLYRLNRANGAASLRPVEIGIPNDYPEQRFVADLLEDARGSLWIAAPSGLYRRWPDGSAARYMPTAYFHDLLKDHEGHLWAGTRLQGFFRFSADGTHNAPVVDLHFTYPRDLPRTPWVYQLFETSDHRFWVAAAGGLLEFFPDSDEHGRFRSYTERNGLSSYDITAVNEDLGGNLWVGTRHDGAMKLTRGGFRTYGEQDAIEIVQALFEDRAGNLCLRGAVLGDARTSVFEGGRLDLLRGDQPRLYTRVGCFDGRRFVWFKPAAVTDFGWVQEHVTLQARNGEWWVGTGDGLVRFPKADRLADLARARPIWHYTVQDGPAPLQVFRLFEDSRGNVWVSSFAFGLSRWEPVTGQLRDMVRLPGLSLVTRDWPARSFGEDAAGNVWIGFDGQLARYKDGRFTLFAVTEGLPPGPIVDILFDRSGRLWLASAHGGLVRVDDWGSDRPRFVLYTAAQGLSSNNVTVLAEDGSGHIYLGGGHGLDRFDPATGRIKHFTTADGLVPGLVQAAFRDHKGVLWFGMSKGLARFEPTPYEPSTSPPVLITGLLVGGVPHLVSALGEREMSLADLAPDQNQLQIEFVGLAFGPGEVLRYQYKLEGAHDDWGAAGEHRTVTYASLAPGRYIFSVRAINSDGNVSIRPATLAFTILRPVWQRWWFLSLIALAIGVVVHTAYRYRVARLLEMANMRTRIATDLHDDIGANLTRIALLSDVAQLQDGERRGRGPTSILDGAREDGALASISRIARESVSSMSDIVWAINPSRESLRDLIRRMRRHAEEIFTLRDIELRFTTSGVQDNLKLGVHVRRDLLLIFKEAVNNSARHSRCSRVEIDLRVEGPRLVLAIVDNGVGFDPSIESDGQGLMSMRRRAHSLGGTLEVTSGSGIGTRITLEVRF
jgi:ligand-binding sensor domain-containing protein/signal transduction histidine kinase